MARRRSEDVDAVVRASEQAVGRCRLRAIACAEEATIATVDALEELCGRIDVPSLARNIYSALQAQQLLAWVEKQPESPARAVVLPPLRRTVERRNAFAIGFHGSVNLKLQSLTGSFSGEAAKRHHRKCDRAFKLTDPG
jgi:hypothetical protein